MFVLSVVSVIGLTQAILTFDVVSMMTYAFTIIMGIIFGILQMNATEEYWTVEFYNYALLIEKKRKEEANEQSNIELQQ